MSSHLRRLVRSRAGSRCEYCRFHEDDLPLWPFHVDHIVAGQHEGSDDPSNLAWACQRCNLHKGTNLPGIDPDTGRIVRLFNPRKQKWHQHFTAEKERIAGLSAAGRATIWLLQMNISERRELRIHLASLDRWPPPER